MTLTGALTTFRPPITERDRTVLRELTDRSREVLRRLVEEFMETGQPVGSRTLSRRLSTPVSPATVRNVMADLEEAGLLYAPHVSAGRLPTQMGLRIYVDGLLELGRLTEDERASIEGKCRAAGRTVEEMLTETTEALSGLSGCAGLVLAPKADVPCRQVEFVSLSSGRALAVMVTETGLVENRVIDVPPGMNQSHLSRATNYLNARLAGRTLAELSEEIRTEIEEHRAQLDSLTARVVEAGIAEWANGQREHGSLIVRGRANLIGRCHCDGRPRTDQRAVRRARRAERLHPAFGEHRRCGRGPDLHRCGKQPLCLLRLLDDRRALPRFRRTLYRGNRRDRPDPDQLRPHYPDGRSHRCDHRPGAGLSEAMSRSGRQGWGAPEGTKETMQDETERAEPETEANVPAEQGDAGAASQSTGTDDADKDSAGAPETDDAEGQDADAAADADEDEAEGGEAALKDQLLRALADAENARRRARKDVEEARTYAISRFAQDLLGVADNLGRALESIPAERRESDDAVKVIADGIEMTAREFEAVLGRFGITKIDPLGDKFDYNLHQALFETAETDQPDGTIVQVLQTGYRIGERLLREAMVGVAKGGTAPADGGDAEAESETGSAGADTPADNAS